MVAIMLLRDSPLSPLLFKIYVKWFKDNIVEDISVLQYANAIVFYSSGKELDECFNKLQRNTR